MSFHLPYVLTAVGSLKGRVASREEENTNSIIPAGEELELAPSVVSLLHVLEKRKKSAAMQDRRCILNTETTQYKKMANNVLPVKNGCEIF